MLNALTIDVEDYFQVNAFAGIIRQDQWDSYPLCGLITTLGGFWTCWTASG
jgi:hypothetical protein